MNVQKHRLEHLEHFLNSSTPMRIIGRLWKIALYRVISRKHNTQHCKAVYLLCCMSCNITSEPRIRKPENMSPCGQQTESVFYPGRLIPACFHGCVKSELDKNKHPLSLFSTEEPQAWSSSLFVYP